MQEYRPYRAHLRFHPPNQLLCCFDAVALHLSWNYSILWMSLRIFVDDLWFKSIT